LTETKVKSNEYYLTSQSQMIYRSQSQSLSQMIFTKQKSKSETNDFC